MSSDREIADLFEELFGSGETRSVPEETTPEVGTPIELTIKSTVGSNDTKITAVGTPFVPQVALVMRITETSTGLQLQNGVLTDKDSTWTRGDLVAALRQILEDLERGQLY